MIMFHSIASNQSSSASKSSFTVYGYGLPIRLFTDFKKFLYDLIRGHRTIRENQVMMFNPIVQKNLTVIHLVVQPYHSAHIELFEDR